MLFATGGNATLEVTVTGSKTLRYKWFKDGSEIPKATKNRLTLKKATAARNDGTYKVEVSNGGGTITSEQFNVSIITPVEVTKDPKDASFVMGAAGTLTVTATVEVTSPINGRNWIPSPRNGVQLKVQTPQHSP